MEYVTFWKFKNVNNPAVTQKGTENESLFNTKQKKKKI